MVGAEVTVALMVFDSADFVCLIWVTVSQHSLIS